MLQLMRNQDWWKWCGKFGKCRIKRSQRSEGKIFEKMIELLLSQNRSSQVAVFLSYYLQADNKLIVLVEC